MRWSGPQIELHVKKIYISTMINGKIKYTRRSLLIDDSQTSCHSGQFWDYCRLSTPLRTSKKVICDNKNVSSFKFKVFTVVKLTLMDSHFSSSETFFFIITDRALIFGPSR